MALPVCPLACVEANCRRPHSLPANPEKRCLSVMALKRAATKSSTRSGVTLTIGGACGVGERSDITHNTRLQGDGGGLLRSGTSHPASRASPRHNLNPDKIVDLRSTPTMSSTQWDMGTAPRLASK